MDETACKRGHQYVTIFIDMARKREPVVFVTPGRGKETLRQFATLLSNHGGNPDEILEVVCDMSPAFLSGVAEHLPKAAVTVDWFHIVQIFTRSVDEVRKQEGKEKLAWVRKARSPRAARWRITHYLNWARLLIGETAQLEQVRKALETLDKHRERVVQRWTSNLYQRSS